LVFGGGMNWLFLAVIFTLTAFIFTKHKREYKASINNSYNNQGIRRWTHVISNGIVASSIVILANIFGGKIFAAAFIGAIATSLADTLATEIGIISKGSTRMLNNINKIVTPGISGGITITGLIISFLGALFISIIAIILNVGDISSFKIILIGSISGLLGSISDSVLGAVIQGKYRCTKCNIITDDSIHHGESAILISGSSYINNNIVNVVATLNGALIGAILVIIL